MRPGPGGDGTCPKRVPLPLSIPNLRVELIVIHAQEVARPVASLADDLLVGPGVLQINPRHQGQFLVGVQTVVVGHRHIVIHPVKAQRAAILARDGFVLRVAGAPLAPIAPVAADLP